jgi:hypothetical protein
MEILDELKFFIQPHPMLYPEAGDIYTPKNSYRIRFFFEGGFTVEGQAPELEINFNSESLLILATGASVYRFLRRSFIGFELVTEKLPQAEVKHIKGLH